MPRSAPHIIEGKVFELIGEVMLDPGKLRRCIDCGGRLDDRSLARKLARIAAEIRALDEERRRPIGRYAAEQMVGEAYITANRALDRDLERLTREKAELVAALQSTLHEAGVSRATLVCRSAAAMLGEIGIRLTVAARPMREHLPMIRNREHFSYLIRSDAPHNATGYPIRTLVTYARDAMIEEVWKAVRDDIVFVPLHQQIIFWAMRDRLDLPADAENMPRFRLAG
jgi:hypothetical protein